MEPVKISVYSIVGNSHCVLAKDGERVYQKIKEALEKGRKVALSFLNIELLTPDFLNTAIGKLYGEFSVETIKNALFLCDISAEDRELVKRVVKTALICNQDPEVLAKALRELLRK